MSDEAAQPCPQRDLIVALAQDELDDAQRRQAERILEQSEPCRALFRQLTAGRYPRWPNYTIIGQVGKGGFGVVYKAIHHAKERTEALKVLFSRTPLLTSYFENEVHLIARLRHPNIATLYEAELSTPPLYYTMEFVEGERLNEYLKRREVSLADRIGIIKTVAQAIGYAHSQGVVHRDLKPQNILIDAEGQPHIVDFGIAKKLAEARPAPTDHGSAPDAEGPVGTLGYIAPEQEKGGPVDARADIFALGALLFHCVTGEPARLARVADRRTRLLRERDVARPEDLSAIIGRCVQEAPEQRYASCAELVADLDNYVAGRPILAGRAPSLARRAARVAALVIRDRPVTVRVAALTVLTALLTWYYWAIEAAVFGPQHDADRAVIIGFADSTLRAIEEGRLGADIPGLSPDDILSWRALYARLLGRLAEAEPLVVIFDGHFTRCSEFDDDFCRAVQELGAPVVIAAQSFDVDGEPHVCPEIKRAVTEVGTHFGAEARKHAHGYEVVYAIQRGFEKPIPGLALAAFTAIRFPNCEHRLRIDPDGSHVYIQYRRQQREGPARWEEDPRGLALHEVYHAEADRGPWHNMVAWGWLSPGDRLACALVKARPNSYWQSADRTLMLEDVLAASTDQLRHWFRGRAVVIGSMRSGTDEHTRASGERIFGCQVHAEAIDELLGSVQHHRFRRSDLALRNGLWCGLGVVLVSAVRRRRRRSLRRVGIVCSLLLLLSLWLAGEAAWRVSEAWLLETTIAVAGLLAAGTVTYWTKLLRARQLELAPWATTPTVEEPTLASTVLAETR